MNIYFVLDCSLDRATLTAIKEALLQLGNLLALRVSEKSPKERAFSIGICYVKRNPVSTCHELQVLSKASSVFNLREFHQALSGSTEMLSLSNPHFERNAGTFPISRQISSLGVLLEDNGSQSFWDPTASAKKIVLLGCDFSESPSTFRDTILEAGRQNIGLEFICLNRNIQSCSGMDVQCDSTVKTNSFMEVIQAFQNCSFQNVICDPWLLDKFVKSWLQEITNTGTKMAIMLEFPEPLFADVKTHKCYISPKKLKLSNTMMECQTCRCHGEPLQDEHAKASKGVPLMTCPITGEHLDFWDCQTNGLQMEGGTILYLPSFKHPPSSLDLDISSRKDPPVVKVLSRVRLAALSEDLLFGLPYVLTSATVTGGDNSNTHDDNAAQVFAALCQTLDSTDCGLLCTSNIDWDQGKENPIRSYYILLPVQDSLLMKKVVTAEELLPSVEGCEVAPIPHEVTKSVEEALSKIVLEDYNPLNHDTGCHSKLTWLVKESLQVRTRSKAEAVRRSGRNLHTNLAADTNPQHPVSATAQVPSRTNIISPLSHDPSMTLDTQGGPGSFHSLNPNGNQPQKTPLNSPNPSHSWDENPNPPQRPSYLPRSNLPRPSSLPPRISNVNGSGPASQAGQPVNPNYREPLNPYYSHRIQSNNSNTNNGREVRDYYSPRHSSSGGEARGNSKNNAQKNPTPLEFRSATSILMEKNHQKSQEILTDRFVSKSSGTLPPASNDPKAFSRKRKSTVHNRRELSDDREKDRPFQPQQGHLTIAQKKALIESSRSK